MMNNKEHMTLCGNISTSLDRDFIVDQLNQDSSDQIKVLFEIFWENSCLHYQMDLGAFLSEREVLLQDGIRLEIIDIKFEQTMCIIKL